MRVCGISDSDVLWTDKHATVEFGSFHLSLDSPPLFPGEKDNEGSMFVKFEGEGASAVLTGDANQETELKMLRREDWSAEVLKAGHHGSKSSTGTAWLKAVHPRYVVFSAGLANRYGHPTKEAMDRARAAGADIFRTDRDGDIAFEVRNGDFVRVK